VNDLGAGDATATAAPKFGPHCANPTNDVRTTERPPVLPKDRPRMPSLGGSPIQPTGRDRSTRNPAIRRTSAAARRRWDGSGGAGSVASWARICSARSLGAACMAPWPDLGGAGVPAMTATEDDEQRWAPYYRPPTPPPPDRRGPAWFRCTARIPRRCTAGPGRRRNSGSSARVAGWLAGW
jgi:hypothetical protein